ncbi:MAG: hypothetical protein ACR2J8_04100, partial [Thermomicrobiales bacterium]
MSVFAAIGRACYRKRWLVIGVWLALFAAILPILPKVAEPLKVGGFSSPSTEASRARMVLQTDLGFAPSSMLVIFQSDRLPADSA